MKTLLSFFLGASLVFVGGMLGLPHVPTNSMVLSFLMGVVVGCWVMGFVMWCYAWSIVEATAERFRVIRPGIAADKLLPLSPTEVIPTAEVVEEPNGMDIYDDSDWWKDEQKRQQHRRNQDG